MPDYTLVYDADCGPCTRFKRLVQFLEPRGRVAFASLWEADAAGLLDDVPVEMRHRSFHVIGQGGDVYSASEALEKTMGFLPGGVLLSKAVGSAPFGRRCVRFLYETASRLHDSGSCTYKAEHGGAPRGSNLIITSALGAVVGRSG